MGCSCTHIRFLSCQLNSISDENRFFKLNFFKYDTELMCCVVYVVYLIGVAYYAMLTGINTCGVDLRAERNSLYGLLALLGLTSAVKSQINCQSFTFYTPEFQSRFKAVQSFLS